ncbi:hypothetical protein LIOPPNJA_27640 [Robbsia andropogonis]|nr:hypothetical protein [Robbsia andropogonis]MCP1121676.1 hypothetical protein [Robbsia andropogonis]MCP1131493.1 hypothetical protein [Robbsia andropogonis]
MDNTLITASADVARDAALIAKHGGPTRVAELLGLDPKRGGTQRVQNWVTRGIPPKVKLLYPHLFLPNLHPAASRSPNQVAA